MPTEQASHSPGRYLRACRAGVMACLLCSTVAGLSSQTARADIFQSTGPDGEEMFSDRPPLTGKATLVATFGNVLGNAPGAAPGQNAGAAASAALPDPGSASATTAFDAGTEEERLPPPLAEPFKPGGKTAAGKSFTTGD